MTKLTKSQRQTLRFYSAFKDKKPTVLGMINYNAKIYVINVIAFSAITAFIYFTAGWYPAYLVVAVMVGAFSRDIGRFRKLAQTWPAMREITDWNKVHAFLAQDPVK
jgi:hypothetical protein